MRELKFRFYDPFNDVMIYSDSFNNLSEFFRCYEGSVAGNNRPSDIMLYAGFEDKNGKEIYEFDLIEMVVNIIDGYDPAFNSEITHNENLNYKIVMGDIPEWLKLVPLTDEDNPYSCEDYSWWLVENPEIKIIGNMVEYCNNKEYAIYENPNLLKED